MTTNLGDENGGDQLVQRVVYVLQQPEPVGINDEVDLAYLLQLVRQRWQWIVGFTAFVVSIAIVYAVIATPWYRAETILLPVDSKAGSGLSGQLAQFGGLADLIGINVGSSGKQEPLATLRSKGFVRRFVEQNDLLPVLKSESRGLLGPIISPANESAELQAVVDWFAKSRVAVTEDKKSGLITVSVEWKDADIAADWANAMAGQLNDEMRLRALSEAATNIDYLQGELDRTDVVSLQQSISRLLELEMQKVMMAKGTKEYSLRVIDEARSPPKRSRPKRTFVVIIALIVGLFVSFVFVIVSDWLKRLSVAR